MNNNAFPEKYDVENYDVVIIGAGASGLMCAASPAWADIDTRRHAGGVKPRRLILEGDSRFGLKLLMSGGGHCNITHEGDMRELLAAYGEAGKKLRPLLYRHGNREMKAFLENAGVSLYADETGRVLPVSMKARDVLDAYLAAAKGNGFSIKTGERVTGIRLTERVHPAERSHLTKRIHPAQHIHSAERSHPAQQKSIYCISTERAEYRAKSIVIATGGCSYPVTGSDGKMFDVLKRDLGVEITALSPALVPVIPEEYPYEELAGISLAHVRISIHRDGQKSVHREGALLFTHGAFSGPCALDISSHAARGSRIALNYIHPATFDDAYAQIRAQGLRTAKAVAAAFCVPRRLAALLVQRAAGSPKRLAHYLTEDTFVVAGTEGFKTAMVTKGGAALRQFDLSTMELRSHPGVYVIGEALDADGISGGYNLQLCWSTAQAAANAIAARRG